MTISVSTQEINECAELPVLLLPPVVVGAAPLQQLGEQAQPGQLLLGLHGLAGPHLLPRWPGPGPADWLPDISV